MHPYEVRGKDVYYHLLSSGISDADSVCRKILKMHATWDSVCELSVVDFGKLVALLPVSVEDANLLGHYWGKEACQRMRRAIAGSTMQFDDRIPSPPAAEEEAARVKQEQLAFASEFAYAVPNTSSRPFISPQSTSRASILPSEIYSSFGHTTPSFMPSSMPNATRESFSTCLSMNRPYQLTSSHVSMRSVEVSSTPPSSELQIKKRAKATIERLDDLSESISSGNQKHNARKLEAAAKKKNIGKKKSVSDVIGTITKKRQRAKASVHSKKNQASSASRRRQRYRGEFIPGGRTNLQSMPAINFTMAVPGAEVAIEWDGLWCRGRILRIINKEVVVARYSFVQGESWDEWLPLVSTRLSSGIAAEAENEKKKPSADLAAIGNPISVVDSPKKGLVVDETLGQSPVPLNARLLTASTIKLRSSLECQKVRKLSDTSSLARGSEGKEITDNAPVCNEGTTSTEVERHVSESEAEVEIDRIILAKTVATLGNNNHMEKVCLTRRQLMRDQPEDPSEVLREPRMNRISVDRNPLNNRRVQLWWPGPQEWFNGVAKLHSGIYGQESKYRIMYDDGDVEIVSESYLRTHRHVYLFPYDPKDDDSPELSEDRPHGKKKRRTSRTSLISVGSKRERRQKVSKGDAVERDEDTYNATYTPKGGKKTWKITSDERIEDEDDFFENKNSSVEVESESDEIHESDMDFDAESVFEDGHEFVLYLSYRRRWAARLRWKQAWVGVGFFFTKRHALKALADARILMPTHNVMETKSPLNTAKMPNTTSNLCKTSKASNSTTLFAEESASLDVIVADNSNSSGSIDHIVHHSIREDNVEVDKEHEESPAWLLTLLSSTNILNSTIDSMAKSLQVKNESNIASKHDFKLEDVLPESLVENRKRPSWSRPDEDSSDSESDRYSDVSDSELHTFNGGEDSDLHSARRPRIVRKRGSSENKTFGEPTSSSSYLPLAYRSVVSPSLRVKVDDSFARALNDFSTAVATNMPSDLINLEQHLLKLCKRLAINMTRTYQLIAGDGAPILKLPFTEKNKKAMRPSRTGLSKAPANRLLAAAQNLRDCFDDSNRSALRYQALEANTILEFPEFSRAKRRFTEQGQGGSGSVFGSRGQGHLKVADDCPEDVKPALDVVRACLRSDPDPLHDLRFAVDTPLVSDEDSGLFGEFDVIANRDIQPGEMGPYSGIVLRDDEVLRHLAKKPRCFLRAMHFWYSVIFEGATGGSTTQSSAVRNTFSIFPFAGNPMALVNDYCGPDRSNANKAKCSDLQNCKYQVVKANGWPYVFLMATKKIPAGQPLRVDYGDAFWDTWHSLRRLETSVDETFRVLFETVRAINDATD